MKRSFRLIFALWGLLFLTVSCGGNPSADGEAGRGLTRLDSLVEADADSALRLMGRMQSQGWPHRDAMRLELLRAKAMNRADSLFTTDSLMLRVAEYYRSHGSQNDRMLSLYLLGCTYRDMGAAPRAIETWQQAVAEADTNASDCDLSTLMRIHSQMNELYTRQRLSEYAKNEIEETESLCWRMKDTLNALIMEEKKCGLLFEEGNYEECIKATEQVYKQYLQSSFKDEAALALAFAIKSSLALENYDKTKHYLDIYEAYCLSEKDYRKIDGGLAPLYIYKSNYYLGTGNIDSAEYCFRKAMPEVRNTDNALQVYKGLYKLYGLRGEMDSVMKYISLYSEIKEKVYYSSAVQATIDAKNLYDYSVEQRIAKEENAAKAIFRLYLIIAGVVILLLCLILYGAQYRWNIQKKQKEEVIKKTRESYIKIDKELTTARLDNVTLKAASQEVSNKLQSANEDVKVLKEENVQLHSILAQDGEKNRKSLHKIADSIKEGIKNKKKDILPLHKAIQIRTLTGKIYPEFQRVIIDNPVLSDDEKRVCTLIKNEFKPFEIETVMNMKQSYSSQIRKRLLLKLCGKNGSPSDFDKFILELK